MTAMSRNVICCISITILKQLVSKGLIENKSISEAVMIIDAYIILLKTALPRFV